MSIETINPSTGARLREYQEMPARQVSDILHSAAAEFRRWRTTPLSHRAQVMRRAAETLRSRRDELAVLMAGEMGKPVSQGRAEADKCARVCDYYAEHAERFLTPEPVSTEATRSFVVFQPLGVILAIMPWNFPFWQVFRFAAPALMAGNAAVLKHASNVPGCALAIEALLHDAGVPDALFRSLLIGAAAVPEVIAAKEVQAVTLTGSSPAGREVAAHAGRNLKKTVLELGGSDPYIIFPDADLDLAARTCAASRLVNAGQSCIAAKRFIVVDSVREEFLRRFVEHMRAAKVGDPMDEQTEVGPLARHELRDILHRQVQDSAALGARVVLGGELPRGPGAFYPATVLVDVRRGMPASSEELFGPVAAVISARDEAEALAIANDSPFGLGAAIFTRDAARGERIAAERLEAGACFVNAMVRSDPRLPFGGIKESGYGRELSWFGIREFVNIKTVYVS